MDKKKYKNPRVITYRVDCDIVMQTVSDPIDPNCTPNTPLCPDPPPEFPGDFINPLKWFK
jgi:hypothetical protein